LGETLLDDHHLFLERTFVADFLHGVEIVLLKNANCRAGVTGHDEKVEF
jgi:hypothetical protein